MSEVLFLLRNPKLLAYLEKSTLRRWLALALDPLQRPFIRLEDDWF